MYIYSKNEFFMKVIISIHTYIHECVHMYAK